VHSSVVMDGLSSSVSSSVVGAFASNRHRCGDVCEHPLLKARKEIKCGTARNDRCAAAHALHVAPTLGRKRKSSESDALLEALIHPQLSRALRAPSFSTPPLGDFLEFLQEWLLARVGEPWQRGTGGQEGAADRRV